MSDPQTSQPATPAASPHDAKTPTAPAGENAATPPQPPVAETAGKPAPAAPSRKPEVGGPKGPEPTRYGDWEKGGRCFDF